VLSSVCTSSDSEEKLMSYLQPLFTGKNKTKQNEEEEKNKMKIEPKIVLEIEILDSNNNINTNSNDNTSSEKTKRGSRKSKKNQKLNSSKNLNTNFDDEKPSEIKIEKKVEEETQSKRISDMLRKLSISYIDNKVSEENIFIEKNNENELIANQSTSINFGDVLNGNKSTVLDLKIQNEPDPLKLKANDADLGIEEIYLFINQSLELQQFFEFEIKNILYQIVTASTKYSTDNS
jgi:hypothetical protein